jgi:preprotein translocase subunit SecY|tara:strand:+ start:1125 stop:1340 length:216 start_codon:yes stop_codon:yes gene_type:complete
MKDLFKPLNTSIELFQEKLNFLFFMIEILLFLIIVILIIWIYGFIRRNLGIDKQTKELEKIRKIMEKKFNE